jgi:putative ABC transport system ATP-binding protein
MMTSTSTSAAISLHGVSRIYGRGAATVRAVDDVDLDLPRGVWTAVMGPSGSGKSTLLHCAAGLERVDTGRVLLGDSDITAASDRELTALRRSRIGFAFQDFNLIGSLSAEQNVALPLRLAGRRPARTEVRAVLAAVGLADRARHRPREMSGGQQQRVAIARAMVTRPEVLFADEPTGALDSVNGEAVMRLLRSATQRGVAGVVVTHEAHLASWADRVVFIRDGHVVDQTVAPPGPESLLAAADRR